MSVSTIQPLVDESSDCCTCIAIKTRKGVNRGEMGRSFVTPGINRMVMMRSIGYYKLDSCLPVNVTPFLRSPLGRMLFLPHARIICKIVVFLFVSSAIFVCVYVSCFYVLCLLCPCFLATMFFAGCCTFLVRCFLLSAFPVFPRPRTRFGLVWFGLSCDHGWIRSGSVNVG